MIRDPECPRCYGSLEAVWDGAAQVLRCSCGHVEQVDLDPALMSELRRAAAAVVELRGSPDLDERGRVLDKYRLVQGKRRRTR